MSLGADTNQPWCTAPVLMTGLPRLSVEPLLEPRVDEALVQESPPRRLTLEPIDHVDVG